MSSQNLAPFEWQKSIANTDRETISLLLDANGYIVLPYITFHSMKNK